MMRRHNLLALRRRRFVVTTDANHKFEVYLNLARRMKLTGIDQLWIADITYIRLEAEFVYLPVILDAFSRTVVGSALDRKLASRLTIAALERAIAWRHPQPGLVHHSDRGLQYACGDYVAVLEKYGIVPSMSRPANPYDNASCESFMTYDLPERTLPPGATSLLDIGAIVSSGKPDANGSYFPLGVNRPPWSERTEVYEVLQRDEIKLQKSSDRANP